RSSSAISAAAGAGGAFARCCGSLCSHAASASAASKNANATLLRQLALRIADASLDAALVQRLVATGREPAAPQIAVRFASQVRAHVVTAATQTLGAQRVDIDWRHDHLLAGSGIGLRKD